MPRTAFCATGKSAGAGLSDRYVGKGVEELLPVACGAILIAGHSHQHEREQETDHPANQAPHNPK